MKFIKKTKSFFTNDPLESFGRKHVKKHFENTFHMMPLGNPRSVKFFGFIFDRFFAVSTHSATLRFASVRRKSCPFMIAVSRLWLVFDAALMVKKDLIH